MLISVLAPQKMFMLSLPQKVHGQYWLENPLVSGENLINVEAIEGKWVLKSNKKAVVYSPQGKMMKNIVLQPRQVYPVVLRQNGEKIFVYTQPVTQDRQLFEKYIVGENTEITIGRDTGNDIVVANKFVSASHCTLAFKQGIWYVSDHNSANGTYCNNKKVENKQLYFGDTVEILGFKIILGNSFIAMNNPDGIVQVSSEKLRPFVNQKVNLPDDDEEYILQKEKEFHPSPRFKRDIVKPTFQMDNPPQPSTGDQMPAMLVIGPSVTMGMASMATGAFVLSNAMATGDFSSAIPSVVMCVSMLLGTMLWPVLSRRYEKKRRKKNEVLRQEKYREYLDKMSVRFQEECAKQEEILRENYIDPNACAQLVENKSRNLWERGFGQNDFLKLRVGLGQGDLQADIQYNKKTFSVTGDNLQEELYTLCSAPKKLNNIPIVVDIFKEHISGVIGEKDEVHQLIKELVLQLVTYYSFEDVKLVFLYDDNSADFGFVKWLPHVWNDNNSFRFVATNEAEAKEVSAELEKVFEGNKRKQEGEDKTPYCVIFSLSRELSLKTEILKQILKEKTNLSFSVVHGYETIQQLPRECTTVLELYNKQGKIFNKNDTGSKVTEFVPDTLTGIDFEYLSRQLANIPLQLQKSNFKLPDAVTFLEMLELGKVEHLNVMTRWRENNPVHSLEAPIGIDTMGGLFKLDLHEKFHGPHGLIAGMTGSGKSELIISFILSLAVNYHPNEVAFILIDYKGGGMAKSFEKLPHTAGIITNLDGAAIKRSLVSIESELKRRQFIFAKAGKDLDMSSIDIYKYQQLYRENRVKEPLQHLFIVADEFAELKTQQPDFMEKLISAARIGRSLGVHLILATQKPSGVVDDQIWSNSKFRLSLRVQERADSMDMIKRPEAAEITQTGRFYLQVGYNELFEMGQSAWAGAPYYPADRVVKEKDKSVTIIDKNGSVLRQVVPENRRKTQGEPPKQMDQITKHLQAIAKEENIQIRPLWLPPIPPVILVGNLAKKYKVKQENPYILEPLVGEFDDPQNQRQNALRLNLTTQGNAVVYGVSGSGKTSFLNAMVYSLMNAHTPSEVNIYLLDFSAQTLVAFRQAPHVGEVILPAEEEKINNLFFMLQREIEKRKELFADYGGDYQTYIQNAKEKLPNIVVAIHNFSAFLEMYEEEEDMVAYLTREGSKYGIYFVLTALGTSEVRFRLLQNFNQLFVLQLNDEIEYSSVVGRTDGMVPSPYKGRGLVRKEELYEFQTAFLTEDKLPTEFIQRTCKELAQLYKGNTAARVKVLPQVVDNTYLRTFIDKGNKLNVPIGVATASLEPYYWKLSQRFMHQVLSEGDESIKFAYLAGAFLADDCNFKVTLIDPQYTAQAEEGSRLAVCNTRLNCAKEVEKLFDTVASRHNAFKDAEEEGRKLPEFEREIIVFCNLVSLKNNLDDKQKQQLDLLLEKGEAKYNLTVILAEQAANMGEISFDTWYKGKLSPKDGIWLGNGIDDQYHLKSTKILKEMREEILPGFGFSIHKGKGEFVKFLYSEE